ncbi:B12-binding domain-containing protein [Kitasatospora sp. NPDC059463]|uniref:cobalamin B12-binding domain-containing protein n=1 Tax=unclassified Kitasatospora TaxID=2633591 RepID=UPI0036C957A8
MQTALWSAVVGGDEYAAVELLRAALEGGLDEESLLLDVIAPVQHRVGAEWAADRLTVAQEHAATAINERAMTALAHRRPAERVPAPRGRVTVSCVDGEWHAFPARLLAETLRLRGWQVDFLGAQTPTAQLIAHLHHTDPDAVLLSGSLPVHLPAAHTAITACQAVGVPVMVGGRAFGADGRHARALGADRWAPDARGAAAVLEAGLTRPSPAAVRHVIDDLPHLSDQEFTLVSQTRSRLVKQTLADLAGRVPAVGAYDDDQRERTAEDIAHIVDFLTAALYVDDAEVFADFLLWTADILAVRKVPAQSLAAAVGLLAGQLRDFPRALGLLRRGGAALRTRSVPGPRS